MRVYAHSSESMREIPDNSVQCCVTSPPYYGLRDYGAEGQIGVEATVDEYVARLVAVFEEVRRVLRADGTLWLNLGDSYATGSSSGSQGRTGDRASRAFTAAGMPARMPAGLKPKDLIGLPWRVAFALQAEGWWLRDAIVWAKPNPMPSSVDDRCTPSYEMVFMLTKSARYFADMAAVREPLKDPEAFAARARSGDPPAYKHDEARVTSQQSANRVWNDPEALARILAAGANPRNVWTIATTPYADAHFATFPPELPAKCIRIGSRPGDVVLDPFMGSGTVAQVAESLGRRWVGYEINAAYHPLIAERTRQIGLL